MPQRGKHRQHRHLRPLNVFTGQVVDHEGKPVPGAKVVTAQAEDGFIGYSGGEMVYAHAPEKKVLLFFTIRNGKGSGETTTDAEGRFRFEGLRAGKYNLLALHTEIEEPKPPTETEPDSYYTWTNRVRSSRGIAVVANLQQPNSDNPITVKLERPTWIEGNLCGLPPHSMEQFVHTSLHYTGTFPWLDPETEEYSRVFMHPNVNQNAEGNFKVGPLPCGGVWQLQAFQYARARSFGATLLSVPITLEPGGTTTFNVDLTQGPQLSGQVLDPEGKPAEDVAVSLRAKTPGESSSPVAEYGALSDKEGKYTIRGAPEGKYELTAQRWAPRVGPG